METNSLVSSENPITNADINSESKSKKDESNEILYFSLNQEYK